METLFYYTFNTRAGKSLFAWKNNKLVSYYFDSPKPKSELTKKYPHHQLKETNYEELPKNLKSYVQKIQSYFNEKACSFSSSEIDWSDFTDFQTEVYQCLIKTKPGEIITYKDLAIKAGKPGAARAVGSFMRKNPIPIIIPCHRVFPASMKTGNYSSYQGPKMKERLINWEQKKDRF